MNSALVSEARRVLSAHCGTEIPTVNYRAVSGGSINEAYVLSTGCGEFFIKYNNARKHPLMFVQEEKGLKLLAVADGLRVPKVIATGTAGSDDYILMEFLQRGISIPSFWEDFGIHLANLHRCSQVQFGLDHDNYMGSLKQSNKMKNEYCSFFIEERLLPQLTLAGRSLNHLHAAFDNLFKRLPEIIPAEKPSLVHGDLWSGNFLIGPEGKACLIDPAAHYGHRECDIAMSKLFGGFDQEFYDAYHRAFPMDKGWENRMDIFNLYPLLIHVNLFGGGYAQQVAAIVKKFA